MLTRPGPYCLRLGQGEADAFQVAAARLHVVGWDGRVDVVAVAGDGVAHHRRNVLAGLVVARFDHDDIQQPGTGLAVELEEAATAQHVCGQLALVDPAHTVDDPLVTVTIDFYELRLDLKHGCSLSMLRVRMSK